MLKLYFLLGERRHFATGEDLLVNILDSLSLYKTAYTIDYCYETTPASKKIDRVLLRQERREQLIKDMDPETIVVGMGWMAIELLIGIPKTRASKYIGFHHPVSDFQYDAWFTYDPAAALFNPNLYVDILACCSAAIRYSGRQIIINTRVPLYQWHNL